MDKRGNHVTDNDLYPYRRGFEKDFETFCDSIGMSMSTAVNIFIKKSVREQRIPFEITAKGNTEKE